MRNNSWLTEKLESIWGAYFADVSRPNEIRIEFGRNARTRLGSIRKLPCTVEKHNTKKFVSQILITGYFKDKRVPEFMIDAVIAHELCHYAHGFSSPLPQLFRYPHQGGAVDYELIKRGLGDILIAQRKWLKTEWKNIIGPAKKNRPHRNNRKKQTYISNLLNFFNPNIFS
jgi:hypothetical protein